MAEQWETCEIEATSTPEGDGCRARFWAKASSPEGAYNAGESESFTCTLPIEADYQAQGHLQALIRRLVEDGWTPDPLLEPHPYWYSHHFRRRITAQSD